VTAINRPGRPLPATGLSLPRSDPLSHIVTIATRVRDPEAVAAACRRLGLPGPEPGTARLYAGEASGLIVRLPGWEYPAVVDTDSGTVAYDNYGGRWGDPARLGLFLQAYAVEKAKLEARRAGHAVIEQTLADGSIRLAVGAGGRP
jgi:hypothetical protein